MDRNIGFRVIGILFMFIETVMLLEQQRIGIIFAVLIVICWLIYDLFKILTTSSTYHSKQNNPYQQNDYCYYDFHGQQQHTSYNNSKWYENYSYYKAPSYDSVAQLLVPNTHVMIETIENTKLVNERKKNIVVVKPTEQEIETIPSAQSVALLPAPSVPTVTNVEEKDNVFIKNEDSFFVENVSDLTLTKKNVYDVVIDYFKENGISKALMDEYLNNIKLIDVCAEVGLITIFCKDVVMWKKSKLSTTTLAKKIVEKVGNYTVSFNTYNVQTISDYYSSFK